MNFKKTAETLTKGAHTLERNFYTSTEILNKEYHDRQQEIQLEERRQMAINIQNTRPIANDENYTVDKCETLLANDDGSNPN